MKKYEQPKGNSSKNPNLNKDKVGQSSSNSLVQKCFGCQDYGHIKSECPTYLKSKDKAMVVTLSDNKESDHEFGSDQEGNFIAFTTIAVVDDFVVVDERPSDRKLSKNADLQEAYNKPCKIAAKDAMNVDLCLKKIGTLKHENKNLLVKLLDTNELINVVKIENMSLIENI